MVTIMVTGNDNDNGNGSCNDKSEEKTCLKVIQIHDASNHKFIGIIIVDMYKQKR